MGVILRRNRLRIERPCSTTPPRPRETYGPANHLGIARDFCAQQVWLGNDADARQVQAIGIPAGANRRVTVRAASGMPFAGFAEQRKLLVIKFERNAAELLCAGRTAWAVSGVVSVILAPAIVEDAEEPHDLHIRAARFGQPQADLFNASPMPRSVNGLKGYRGFANQPRAKPRELSLSHEMFALLAPIEP